MNIHIQIQQNTPLQSPLEIEHFIYPYHYFTIPKTKRVKSLMPQPDSNPQLNINQAIIIQSRNWGFIWVPLNHFFTKIITKTSPTTKNSPLFASSNYYQMPFHTLFFFFFFISLPYSMYSQGSDPLCRTSFQDHLTISLHTLYALLTAPHSIQNRLKIFLHKLALYAPNLQIY